MTGSRFRLKALGLCALVVGLMALSAGSAQATVGSSWFLGGAGLSEPLKPEAQATLESNMGSLLTTLGGKGIHILCTAMKLIGMVIFNPGGGALGKADFSGCEFLELVTPGGATKKNAFCTPSAEGVSGLIITNYIKGLIELHEPSAGVKEGFVKFSPDTGTISATIHLGEECAFGENLKIGGTIGVRDCNQEFTVEKTPHLFEPVLQSLVVNEGTTAATLDGSANVRLTGIPHEKLWSGKPA